MIKKVKIKVGLKPLDDWIEQNEGRDNIGYRPYNFCGSIYCESQQQTFWIGYLDDFCDLLWFFFDCKKKIQAGTLEEEIFADEQMEDSFSISIKNNQVVLHECYPEGFKDEIMTVEEFEDFCDMCKRELLHCIQELDIADRYKKYLLDHLEKSTS